MMYKYTYMQIVCTYNLYAICNNDKLYACM